jgi:hypothetical protein
VNQNAGAGKNLAKTPYSTHKLGTNSAESPCSV